MSDAVRELVIRIKREVDPSGVAASKAAHDAERKRIAAEVAAVKQAEREKAAAAKQAAKEQADAGKQASRASSAASKQRLADVRKTIAESKRLERELFNEGRQLAAQQAARERRDERNAVASAKLAYGEKKKALDAQTRATDEAAAATRQMTRALLGTQAAGAALNLVKTGIDAVSQSAAEARSRIQAMNAEAAAARHADREVAALTGNKATVGFSASLAGEAAQAGVSPEVYRSAQSAFQAQAGQFIGNDKLSKISQENSADLLKRVASFSASQGVDVGDSAKLMGTIIGKSAKGTSSQDLMTTFGKVFRGVQLAPGQTGPLLDQLSEIIQEEVGEGGAYNDVLEALPLIRVMAERNPGEASTYGRSLIRGLREIRMDPKKAAEMGIGKGMNFMQQVQAVSAKAAAVGAAGGDEGEFLSRFFPDIRTFGGVRTALNAGIRGGGFDRATRDMAGVSDAAIGGTISDYLSSEEGRAQTNASRLAQARLERASTPGMRMLADARARAAVSLESSGELNKGEGFFGSIFTMAGSAAGHGDRRQQEETALVGAELRQRLEGFPEGRKWLGTNHTQYNALGVAAGPYMNPEGLAFGLGGRATPEHLFVEGFNKLAELQRQQIKATQALQGNGTVPKPAAAKPAPGPGRL